MTNLKRLADKSNEKHKAISQSIFWDPIIFRMDISMLLERDKINLKCSPSLTFYY